jgi:hypothetical protein
MRDLLHNSIKCPDGTILVSKHSHDFQRHVQKDGREYFVDGGLEYQRIGYSDEQYVNLSAYSDDPHELIRERFEWTRNLDADDKPLPEPEVIKLKGITDPHLSALVEWTKDGYPDKIHKVFVDELKWRKSNG